MTAQLERAEAKKRHDRVAELEAELLLPQFPAAVSYLWRAYIRLRRRQSSDMNGPKPVSWSEIDAFARLTGMRLAPWEVSVIESLDDVFLKPDPKIATPDGQTLRAAASANDGRGVRTILGSVGRRRVVKRKKSE